MRKAPLIASVLWSLAALLLLLARGGQLPFGVLLGGFTFVGAAALASSVWGAYMRWGKQQALPAGWEALVAFSVLFVGLTVWSLTRFPWLRDVAAAEIPPTFQWLTPQEAAGASAYDEPTRTLIERRYPSLKPSRLSMRPEKAFGFAVVAAGMLPRWRLEKLDPRNLRLEGTARTSLGFDSQIAVAVRPAGRETLIEVRARSHIPTGDFGENARVIHLFYERLGHRWMCRPPADFAAKRQGRG